MVCNVMVWCGMQWYGVNEVVWGGMVWCGGV